MTIPTNNLTSLRPFGEALAAAQFGIYRAEWQLEAEGDAGAIPDLIRQQLTFHALCQNPELTNVLAGAPADDFAAIEYRRLQAHANGISADMLQQGVGAALQCLQAWHAARAANDGKGDFSIVAEPLAQLIAVQRGLAAIKAGHLSNLYGRTVTPYGALIDAYDPGRRLDFIKTEFARLVPVCQAILNAHDGEALPPALFPAGEYPMEKQHQLAIEIMTAMGYDAHPPRGKLGLSAHPFCRRVGDDEVWLTMRGEESPLAALITVVHEGGHGRYYQGLAKALGGTWESMVAGESLNEGMALLAEHIIGRRPSFARYLTSRLNRAFDLDLTAEAIHADLTQPTRDPIRAVAGEAVYPLHLILRTEIEEMLIDGNLDPRDLPAVWNKRSHELLGITPASDAEGCLQDIHLFAGYLGYFPSYLLGHMAAAQLFPALEAAMPELDDQIAEGDFAGLNGWLHDHVYSAGRTQPVDLLLHRLTGRHFAADALIGHLQARYAKK